MTAMAVERRSLSSSSRERVILINVIAVTTDNLIANNGPQRGHGRETVTAGGKRSSQTSARAQRHM